MTPLAAVIPAGGTIDGPYRESAGASIRCLSPVGGRPVLQIVVDALKATNAISQIVCAAPAGVEGKISGVDEWTSSGRLGTDSIRQGIRCLEHAERVLVCTSDLPFITSEAIASFIERSNTAAEVSIGLVAAKDYDAAFPGSPPSTYANLRETGPVTIGGAFLLTREGLRVVDPWIDRLFCARKSLLQSAKLLGPEIAFQLLLRKLSLSCLLKRAKKLTGLEIDVVAGVSPQLAFDIDTLNDYEYAKAKV